MAEKYYSILTNRGKELEAAAAANGTNIIIKDFVTGDGGGQTVTPDPAKTKLVNEVYRTAISSLNVSPEQANQFVAHLVIPADVGGFTVREVGLLTDEGELYAVANCASIEKPTSGISINLQFRLAVSETSNIELKVATGDGLFLRQDANLKDVKDKKESRENLGLGELAVMAGEANKFPYFNEEDSADLADITDFSREMMAQSDALGALTKLGIIALGIGSTGMGTIANVDWQQVDMVSGSIAIWRCSNWINAPDGLPTTSLVVAEVTGRSGTSATVNITAFNASSNRRIWSVYVESVNTPGSRTFNVLEIMTSGNPTPISAGGTGASNISGALENLGLRDVARSRSTPYLTAGTFAFTVPAGVYRIKCRVIGGGGGAGGSASAKSGGGGGAGGYAEGGIDVIPGQTITITVGAGGQGGTAGNFGASGGLSSVGGFMSASGGAYGDAGGGGTGAGGFGGIGSGGDINSVGSDGSDGTTNGAAGGGTGGGSSLGGATRSGGTGRNSLSIGGGGAACYLLSAQSGGNGHAGAVILDY